MSTQLSQSRAAIRHIRLLIVSLAATIVLCVLLQARPARGDDSGKLLAALRQCRFIAYTPRGFAVIGEKVVPASRSGIKEDLAILRPYFDGIITYSAVNTIETVAAAADELGYRAVIIGIWDPFSETEINNALTAFRTYPDLVVAVVVGNEGIYTKRYSAADVSRAILQIKKRVPILAVTTSEPFFLYFKPDYSGLFNSLDLQMPNIHPVFEPWFRPTEPDRGVTMVVDVAKKFETSYRQPLLIKETGMPSAGASGYSPARQAGFWTELGRRFPISPTRAFAYFEAFDAPWKPAAIAAELPGDHSIESHWGLFTDTGQAKVIVKLLPPLKELSAGK